MPIEIREVNIKTNVVSSSDSGNSMMNERELSRFREQLLEECKKLIQSKTNKKRYKR